MNTTNPFQVPSCLQRAQFQQRRQHRLKQIVIGSIAALTTLLVFLLVEGCMSERAQSASLSAPVLLADAATSPAPAVPAPAADPASAAQPQPVTPPAPVALAPLRNTISPVIRQTAIYYVVKSGDTLTRIARLHRVPVKTIMALNNLSDDHILVGTKLKLPTA